MNFRSGLKILKTTKINKMKNIYLTLLCVLACSSIGFGQVQIEIEGAIQIANSEDPIPDEGTLRYNETKSDFEGWNGIFWASMTGFDMAELTDYDGNVYKTVKIDDQEWMAENLRVTHYNDGVPLDLVVSNTLWGNISTGAYCSFENLIDNDYIYGKYYNWYAVESDKVCPTGWRVPTNSDWNNLIGYLGGNFLAGGALKEKGTTNWTSPNIGATNRSGFTGRGTGYRSLNGAYSIDKTITYFWSLSNFNTAQGWWYSINYYDAGVDSGYDDKNYGQSLRCIKD